MLGEFIKYDPENKSGYEDLVLEVCGLQYRKQASGFAVVVPPLNAGSSVDDHPDEAEFESAYSKLSEEEQKRLCCFLLFPAEAEIKKREIIHCWIGMRFMDSMDAEHLLAKFVSVGLIERTFLYKKILNRYRMPISVRSCLLGRQTNPLAQIKNDGSWSILHHQKMGNLDETEPMRRSLLRRMTMVGSPPPDPSAISDGNTDPEALLNVSQTTLNAARFKTMSGMEKLRVVHLGRWHQDSKEYIVVEDIEAFKYLRNLSNVAFLSLEGVSGIVKLPESVYDLRLLKVLDLRACNNLETLPPGIKSLDLTILDLSGCYLLDHVPLGITSLTNLQQLKGFVINNDQLQQKPNGRTKRKTKEKGKRTAASSPCSFGELSKLEKLRKLTILTRKMNFPTPQDFETLCELENLSCLRITWVGNSTTEVPPDSDDLGMFPSSLEKLELQAAPNPIASRLLSLISQDTENCGLEKLYLRGGGLRELKHFFPQPTIVRLRYLPQLQINWDDFIKLFPNLKRLEVLGCPNLALFPCDENGIWENTQ
ncbi:disease resistance RPP13-like protein 4 [Silene latifolia]|uniref:disease resistance RPP13-like protein 4 n=1 Tax=Silene latifolia TaxID=37657 RepID=UPI003D77B4CD